MNFQQLDYVVSVDRHKHFGRAAEACNITQATLSGMIKKLEDELGYQIFDRSTKPISTTESGKELIALADRVLSIQKEMYEVDKHELEELTGSLSLGIIPTIANSLLPIILPPILKENPGLDLTVHEITTAEIKSRLKSGTIDIGLLATPLEEDMYDESIMYYEPMLVYGVTGGKKKYVTTKDITDRKIWLLEEGHCFRNQAMTICDVRKKSNEDSNLNFEGSSFDTLLNLTGKFGGFTLIPELYANDLPADKKKLVKSFQKPIPVREISLVTYRPLARKKTVEYLSKKIKGLVEPLLTTKDYRNSELDIIGI